MQYFFKTVHSAFVKSPRHVTDIKQQIYRILIELNGFLRDQIRRRVIGMSDEQLDMNISNHPDEMFRALSIDPSSLTLSFRSLLVGN